jgi:hypothetical protein
MHMRQGEGRKRSCVGHDSNRRMLDAAPLAEKRPFIWRTFPIFQDSPRPFQVVVDTKHKVAARGVEKVAGCWCGYFLERRVSLIWPPPDYSSPNRHRRTFISTDSPATLPPPPPLLLLLSLHLPPVRSFANAHSIILMKFTILLLPTADVVRLSRIIRGPPAPRWTMNAESSWTV